MNLRDLFPNQCLDAEKAIAVALCKLELDTGLRIKTVQLRTFKTDGDGTAREILFDAEPALSDRWGRDESPYSKFLGE